MFDFVCEKEGREDEGEPEQWRKRYVHVRRASRRDASRRVASRRGQTVSCVGLEGRSPMAKGHCC